MTIIQVHPIRTIWDIYFIFSDFNKLKTVGKVNGTKIIKIRFGIKYIIVYKY